MQQQSWNQRYTENDTVYGLKPNEFFKQFIDTHKPGTLLLPAEGEGRNAIYAAKKGWNVDAFDFSEVAKEKALAFAAAEKVKINYDVMNMADFKADKQYDAIALIYVHQPEPIRKKFHS
ncbi:MAG: class I SAM-dependent methyltransferase, partial [Bacteroidetes bacterium]|nr:class I SAM-dependent methyltransferase [Bacteroidota bacterium]